MTDHTGHHLVDEAVYGPVPTRRYENTLGVNPFPGAEKVCSFDCVYCQLGWTPKASKDVGRPRLATPAEITEGIKGFAERSGESPDAIVVSGNGEPTLHPRFAEITDAVIGSRDEYLPDVPTVCLTNGGQLASMRTRTALRHYDECSIKLDVGTDEAFRRVNLPDRAIAVDTLAGHVSTLENAVIQACFFDGILSNVAEKDVHAWVEAVRQARPRRVDLYSLERAPATHRVHAVARERLQEIALELARSIPIRVRVFAGSA